MTTAAADQPLEAPVRAVTVGALGIAGMASMGAGAIHAAAIGAHAEHRQAVLVFAVVAAVQLGWGAWALTRSAGSSG